MRKILIEHENGFLFAQAILTIVGMFMTCYSMFLDAMPKSTYISLLIYILLAIYSCWGYIKPHGNYLKYLGLLLCLLIVYTGLVVVSPYEKAILQNNQFLDNLLTYIFLFSALVIAHISGRLNKYKSNSVFLIIAIIILIIGVSCYQGVITNILEATGATQQTKFAVHFASYNPPILVATFGISYLTRYDSHINAGKEEDIRLFKE